MRSLLRTVLLFGLLAAGSVAAQTDSLQPTDQAPPSVLPPAPVSGLRAFDSPDDHGHSVTLTWTKSADDGAGANSVRLYQVYRWIPYYLDTMRAAQYRVDSLSSVVSAFRRFIPRAQDSAAFYGENGQSDLAKRYADSASAMKARLADLPDEIKDLERQIAQDWHRAPQAHAQYPDGGRWDTVGVSFAGQTTYSNSSQKEHEASGYLPDHCDYYYRVEAVTADASVRSLPVEAGPVQSSGQWYNIGRTPSLFATGLFTLLVVLFVAAARKGRNLYVRPLAGIEAVDEAIGRATEMGKPILYVLGLGTASDIATIASLTVLGRVAKRVAEYQTELIVPTYDPIVMSVAQETVKSGYYDAGRPDAYKDDLVFFVTQNQFAYVSAINGIMVRQRPATNIYMGKFFAESLILAETGSMAGSIQIAGTDEIAQIPFFVVACDYTLIGEELYAASAYLGREPILLGSLKAQDYAKAAIILLALIGVIAANVGGESGLAFRELFRVVR